MSDFKLRPYQEDGKSSARALFREHKNIVFQLPTGGGKTVIFASICNDFLSKNIDGCALVLVHRRELLKQFSGTMKKWYGITPYPITPGVPTAPARLYVAMAETMFRRLDRLQWLLNNVKFVIIDEAHIGNFRKLLHHFHASRVLGVTATPIFSKGKKSGHMTDHYTEIVCGPQISDLILQGFLTPNITRNMKGINRQDIKIRNGEFDDASMFEAFRKAKNLKNTVAAYLKFSNGKKALVYNVNKEHSMLVTKEFQSHGLPAKHLDSDMPDTERDKIMAWFKKTPGAILNSIGILTTGFDEASVQSIILNRATTSLTLFLQMCGRGGRIMPGKEYFDILDLGGNALFFGDWSDDRDWRQIFFAKEKPKSGVAPVKDCPQCQAILHLSVTTCKYCGFKFPQKTVQYDTVALDFEVTSFISKTIKLDRIYERARTLGYSPSAVPHEISRWFVWACFSLNGIRDENDPRLKIYNEKYIEALNSFHERQNTKVKSYEKTLFLTNWKKRQINHGKKNK